MSVWATGELHLSDEGVPNAQSVPVAVARRKLIPWVVERKYEQRHTKTHKDTQRHKGNVHQLSQETNASYSLK